MEANIITAKAKTIMVGSNNTLKVMSTKDPRDIPNDFKTETRVCDNNFPTDDDPEEVYKGPWTSSYLDSDEDVDENESTMKGPCDIPNDLKTDTDVWDNNLPTDNSSLRDRSDEEIEDLKSYAESSEAITYDSQEVNLESSTSTDLDSDEDVDENEIGVLMVGNNTLDLGIGGYIQRRHDLGENTRVNIRHQRSQIQGQPGIQAGENMYIHITVNSYPSVERAVIQAYQHNEDFSSKLKRWFSDFLVILAGVDHGSIIIELKPESPESLERMLNSIMDGSFDDVILDMLREKSVFELIKGKEVTIDVQLETRPATTEIWMERLPKEHTALWKREKKDRYEVIHALRKYGDVLERRPFHLPDVFGVFFTISILAVTFYVTFVVGRSVGSSIVASANASDVLSDIVTLRTLRKVGSSIVASVDWLVVLSIVVCFVISGFVSLIFYFAITSVHKFCGSVAIDVAVVFLLVACGVLSVHGLSLFSFPVLIAVFVAVQSATEDAFNLIISVSPRIITAVVGAVVGVVVGVVVGIIVGLVVGLVVAAVIEVVGYAVGAGVLVCSAVGVAIRLSNMAAHRYLKVITCRVKNKAQNKIDNYYSTVNKLVELNRGERVQLQGVDVDRKRMEKYTTAVMDVIASRDGHGPFNVDEMIADNLENKETVYELSKKIENISSTSGLFNSSDSGLEGISASNDTEGQFVPLFHNAPVYQYGSSGAIGISGNQPLQLW